MNIVILDGYTVAQDDLSWNRLDKYGEVTYYERTGPDQIISRIGDAEIVITSKCLIDKDVICRCPHLKYIGVIATGYNNIDISYAHERKITVTNIPSYSTDSVAQFTFSLLLEAVNRVGVHNDSVHRGDWGRSSDFSYTLTPQIELAGKTLGIIGYGNIGKRVAYLAEAFHMNVLVHSSHMQNFVNADGVSFVSCKELISRSDIISLHCSLTEDNQKIINKKSIAKMKDGVIFINTSRGPLVDESDLAEALSSGKISVAAIDVMSTEPPKEKNPLINLNNCIITPHIAWNTKESRQRLIDIAVDNVCSFINKKNVNEI